MLTDMLVLFLDRHKHPRGVHTACIAMSLTYLKICQDLLVYPDEILQATLYLVGKNT